MPTQLSQEDKMLLGEVEHQGNAVDAGAAEDSADEDTKLDEKSNGLIAMAGNLVPVDRVGNNVTKVEEASDETSKPAKDAKSKKRSASVGTEGSNGYESAASEPSPSKKSKTTKNGGAAIKEPKSPSPKKRASPKKKATTNKDEPTTPSPKKRSPTKKQANDDDDFSVSPTKTGESTSRNTPRQRAAPGKSMAAPRGIPSSWETADAADRMMVMMKEKGEDWAAIREAWKNVTGQDTANSTLPNRYARIKVNMMHLNDRDAIHLLTAKKEAEAEMWAQVAGKMAAKGCDKYATTFLQKQFKAFEEQASAAGLSIENYVEKLAVGGEEGDEGGDEGDSEGEGEGGIDEEKQRVVNAIDAFVKEEDAEDSE